MSLINMYDVEFTEGNKISKDCLFIKQAIKNLRKRKKFFEQDYEDVFDLGEVLVECSDIAKKFNKYRDNTNGQKFTTEIN